MQFPIRNLIIAALLLAPPVLYGQPAEDPRDAELAKLRDALRNTVGQLRAAQGDVATAQATQVEAERKNAELETKLKNLTQKADADKDLAARAMEELNTALERRNAENTQLREALEKWRLAYENAAKVAGTKENERAGLAARVIELEQDVAARERNNLELYRIGKEVLERYKDFGLGRAIAAREPFTGLARVSLENQIQDYDEKLLLHKDKIGESPQAMIEAAHAPANTLSEEGPAKKAAVRNPPYKR